MENNEIESLRCEIRRFSRCIVRHDVTSDQLPAFLNALLTDDLFEPHSCLRIAAAEIAKHHPEMSARKVAAEMLRAARRHGGPKPLAPADSGQRKGARAPGDSHRLRSTLPEFCLATGFTTVGVLHLVTWLAQIDRNPPLGWNNWEWSAAMSGGYLLAGMLFFYSALSQWFCNRRRKESPSAPGTANRTDATRSQIVRFQTKHPRPR